MIKRIIITTMDDFSVIYALAGSDVWLCHG